MMLTIDPPCSFIHCLYAEIISEISMGKQTYNIKKKIKAYKYNQLLLI